MMRRPAALIAIVTACLAALGAAPASAHQSPANCVSNSLDLTVTKSRTLVRNGDTIDYTVEVANRSGTPCDVTGAEVVLTLPAADGTPTGRQVVLATNVDYPAGMTSRVLGTVPYAVAVNPGVEDIVVRARAAGVLHDAPVNHAADITKTLGTTVTQPHATLTKRASPDRGEAPLTVTYHYLLTNDSTTNVPIAGASVTDDKCAPVVHTGGDADGDGLIDVGEAWSFTCAQTFNFGATIINTATATGRSTVDNLPIPIPPAQATVVVTSPPVSITPVTTPSSPPSAAPAPAAPAAGAVQGRTYKLVPIKSKLASRDARCISVPKRLSVRAGELTTVRVSVRKEAGSSLAGAVVRITGPGFVDAKTTNAEGLAIFRVRSKRAGTLVIQSNRCLGADRIGVRSARQTNSRRVPRVTG